MQGDGSVIVGGSANLAGKTAFALTRFTAAGVRDDIFGTHGETTTPFGTPAINGYITGMALTGNLLAVSGRLTNAAGLVVTAARYYATGAPPPPAAAARRLDARRRPDHLHRRARHRHDQRQRHRRHLVARVRPEHRLRREVGRADGSPATTNDVDVGVNVTGLTPGTLYHARLVIANGIGTTPGDDVTFTTLGSGGGSQPAGPGAGGPRRSSARCPRSIGKKINKARKKVLAAGCKVKVVYKKSKRPKGIVLKQSRKASKKLVYRAVVKLTVAVKPTAKKKK